MDGDSIPRIILMVVCILLSAYFSAVHTAFFAVNKTKMKELAEDGNQKAKKVLKVLERPDSVMNVTLIGIDLAKIVCAVTGTVFFMSIIEGLGGAVLAAAVVICALLFIGDAVPKSLANKEPDRSAMALVRTFSAVMKVLRPVDWLLEKWRGFIYKRFRGQEEDRSVTEEEIMTMVEEAHSEGEIDSNESELIRNAIEFYDIEVEDIYTSRVDLVAIEENDTREEISRQFEKGFSRLPVYRDTIDNIVGILNQKDFEKYKQTDKTVSELMSSPIFVMPSVKISEVLKLLQSRKSHMAIILDEFGGTVGIVTLEDIIEELVGEIWDEHDIVVEPFVKIGENKYKVNCGADLDDMFELFGIDEESEDVTTVGGWVVEQLGRIPRTGESFDYGRLHIYVSKRAPRRLTEVVITVKTESEGSGEDGEDDAEK